MKIIENTKEAKDMEGHLYGSQSYVLTLEHINALLSGKCIATVINDEYKIFISCEK